MFLEALAVKVWEIDVASGEPCSSQYIMPACSVNARPVDTVGLRACLNSQRCHLHHMLGSKVRGIKKHEELTQPPPFEKPEGRRRTERVRHLSQHELPTTIYVNIVSYLESLYPRSRQTYGLRSLRMLVNVRCKLWVACTTCKARS